MEKEPNPIFKIRKQNRRLKTALIIAIALIICGLMGSFYYLNYTEKLKEQLHQARVNQQEILEAIELKEKELSKIQDSVLRDLAIKQIIDTIEIIKYINTKSLLNEEGFNDSDNDFKTQDKISEGTNSKDNELHQTLQETLTELDNIKEASKKQVRHLLDNDLIAARNAGDYNKVLSILDKADDFGVYTDDIIKHYAEITFIYLKGDQKSKASDVLRKAENVGIIAAIIELSEVSSKDDITTHLKKLVGKGFYKILDEKYLPEMVKIEGGKNAIKNLDLQPFNIGLYPVTVVQWRIYCLSTNKKMPDTPPWGWQESHPVVNISWYEAVQYCNWLSKKEGLKPVYSFGGVDNRSVVSNYKSNGYRLPSEAEWEFAARGGVKSQNYTYSGSNNLEEVAWFQKNTDSKTHVVGSKKANELGLYDMSGNVWEWCFNWYSDDHKEQFPVYKSDGEERSYRGGSWYDYKKYLSLDYRFHYDPLDVNDNIGFRLAKNP